jgi:hypothetical protein
VPKIAETTIVGFIPFWPFLTVIPLLPSILVRSVCIIGFMLAAECCAQIAETPAPGPHASADPARLEMIEVDAIPCFDCQPIRNGIDRFGEGDPQFEGLDMSWLASVKAGYDNGFVIASRREQELGTADYPFWLRFNGWGQLRHTYFDSQGPNRNVNQFQLKRGRLSFSTAAFNSNFRTFVQIDGRSSNGDDIRLLDYYLSWDIGHAKFGLERGTFGVVTGKYKMPFSMARWLSGRDFEFSDRSVASTFFDVNRSFGWGFKGEVLRSRLPIYWEAALFNGLVTGGAETGSSGTLDDNFATSARAYCFPIGEWGEGELADFQWHERLAVRTGCGFASSNIDRVGMTEFSRVRVVDSGERLSDLLNSAFPDEVTSYAVSLFAMDASFKFRGWSSTLEYYFRTIDDFQGADISDLFDQGFWLQLGKFVIPNKLQLLGRWSRVQGNSGTLGGKDQSSDEIACGFAWYFRGNHAKLVGDLTHLDGAPVDSPALDVTPGEIGWLYRTQIQFSF